MTLTDKIDVLRLPTKPAKALELLGIQTVGELLRLDVDRALELRGYGTKTRDDLRKIQGKTRRRCRALHAHAAGTVIASKNKVEHKGAPSTFAAIIFSLGARARGVVDKLRVTTPEALLALREGEVKALRSVGAGTWRELALAQKQLQDLQERGHDPPVPLSFDKAIEQCSARARRVLRHLHINTVEALFRLTEQQVLSVRGIGRGTWEDIERMQSRLGKPALDTPRRLKLSVPVSMEPFSEARFHRTPLFSSDETWWNHADELHESWYGSTPIDELELSSRAASAIHAIFGDRQATLGDLLALRVEAMLDLPNCGEVTVRAVQAAVCHFLMVKNGLRKVPTVSLNSFNDMVSGYLEHTLQDTRYRAVIFCRLGMEGEDLQTLESIASRLGVTRERVRQMEACAKSTLRKSIHLGMIDPLLSVVRARLWACGGIDEVGTLVDHVVDHFQWADKPNLLGFARLVSLDFDVSFSKRRLLSLQKHPCVSCATLQKAFGKLMDGIESISIKRTGLFLSGCCETLCNKRVAVPTEWSRAFIDHLIRSSAQIRRVAKLNGHMIYGIEGWRAAFGGIAKSVGAVLKRCGRSMHFKEVHAELKRLGDTVSRQSVYTALGNCKNALLWDRGTFIHRSLVRHKMSEVSRVERWLLKQLQQDVACVSIWGAFKAHEADCLHDGIPNETALYTCLRETKHPELAFPRYPYVYRRRDDEGQHVPIYLCVEEWLKSADGPVKYADIKRYACKKMWLKEFQFNTLLTSVPNVLRVDDHSFMHTSMLGFDKEQIAEFTSYARDEVSKHGHISVAKLFANRQVTLRSLGVTGPRMLHSLLELYDDDSLDLSHYPQVMLSEDRPGAGLKGVIQQVVEFIGEVARPCSFEEIERRFVKDLGYRPRTVFSVELREEVLKYLPSCLVHQDTLGWTQEKQNALEQSAAKVYRLSEASGLLWAKTDEVLETQAGDLPVLPEGYVWSKTLLLSLLRQSESIHLMGRAGNAFVVVPNRFKIESFHDLLWHILDEEYHGAANLADFSERLRAEGLVRRRLTSDTVGKGNRIVVSGTEIYIKELAQC